MKRHRRHGLAAASAAAGLLSSLAPTSSLNNATPAELEALPGMGPVITRRIIEGRPDRSVDDLGRAKGIGNRRPEEIRPPVTAE